MEVCAGVGRKGCSNSPTVELVGENSTFKHIGTQGWRYKGIVM